MPVHVHAREAEGVRRVTGLAAGDSRRARRRRRDRARRRSASGCCTRPVTRPGSQCFLVEEAGQPGTARVGRHAVPERLRPRRSARRRPRGALPQPARRPEAAARRHARLSGSSLRRAVAIRSAQQKRTNPYLRVATLEGFLGFSASESVEIPESQSVRVRPRLIPPAPQRKRSGASVFRRPHEDHGLHQAGARIRTPGWTSTAPAPGSRKRTSSSRSTRTTRTRSRRRCS